MLVMLPESCFSLLFMTRAPLWLRVFLNWKLAGCDSSCICSLMALASSVASFVVRLLSTLLSIILLLEPKVAKLHLRARSPSFMVRLAPTASRAPLLASYLKGS